MCSRAPQGWRSWRSPRRRRCSSTPTSSSCSAATARRWACCAPGWSTTAWRRGEARIGRTTSSASTSWRSCWSCCRSPRRAQTSARRWAAASPGPCSGWSCPCSRARARTDVHRRAGGGGRPGALRPRALRRGRTRAVGAGSAAPARPGPRFGAGWLVRRRPPLPGTLRRRRARRRRAQAAHRDAAGGGDADGNARRRGCRVGTRKRAERERPPRRLNVEIRFLGHACFEFVEGDANVLVDPFLTGNPSAAAEPHEVEATHILLTHGHGDHIGDSEDIAKRTGATVVAVPEITNELSEAGVENVVDPNLGGTVKFDWGWVKLVPAWHTSTTPKGAVNTPAGLLIGIGGKTVYHLGDTALFSDL